MIVAYFMYSYHNNLLPDNFDHLLLCNNAIHHYDTRSANEYRVMYGRTSFTNSNFICKAPQFWNQLPNDIKHCKTINNFK